MISAAFDPTLLTLRMNCCFFYMYIQ